jgi:hypothetical protein
MLLGLVLRGQQQQVITHAMLDRNTGGVLWQAPAARDDVTGVCVTCHYNPAVDSRGHNRRAVN